MSLSSDSRTLESARDNAVQLPTTARPDVPGTPSRVSSATQNQYSMIGKSIVIKGEIAGSDPVYIYGKVEGSISAPDHRVTVGKEGRVKANISAREVVIMGDVHGNLQSEYRVEIRSEGSLTGDLVTHRLSIEDGAVLQGAVDVTKPSEKDNLEDVQELPKSSEIEEATSAA